MKSTGFVYRTSTARINCLDNLAGDFSHRLIEWAMEKAGMDILNSKVGNGHWLLTDDGVSGGTRIQPRNQHERNCVDVDRLEEDFVSRQVIYTYLTKYRGADTPTGDHCDRVENAHETIQ